MKCKRVFVAMIAGLMATGGAVAQEPPPAKSTDETAAASAAEPTRRERQEEEMRKRLGRWQNEPEQSWSEFIAEWLTPKPYPKRQVVRINEKYAFSHVASSIKMEIVREEGDTVWLRGIPPEDPQSPLYKVWSQRQVTEARMKQAAEAFDTPGAIYFLDFDAEPVPPPFQKSVDFVAAPGDLPGGGRWQMDFAIADFNEDGTPDLVFPPRRQAYPPTFIIMLGGGDGSFTTWQEAKWPTALRIDYGGVAAADMDGDGHQDVVAAIHFGPQYIFYGDGKGDFTRAERLPIHDPRLSARAATVADFDGDGRQDLAFAAEIDYDMKANEKIEGVSSIWVLYRRDDGWKVVTDGFPTTHIADVISADDFDGDGRTDLVVASNNSGERRLVYLNKGPEKWGPARFNGILSSAYHYDVDFRDGEVFATFIQFKPHEGSTQSRNGLIGYPFAFREEGWRHGQPVVFDRERTNVHFRVELGDLNGDGRLDLVAGRKNGGLEVYIRQDDGSFVMEETDVFDGVGAVYGLQVVDIDGDGLEDIIACFVSAGKKPGGVKVWLTRAGG